MPYKCPILWLLIYGSHIYLNIFLFLCQPFLLGTADFHVRFPPPGHGVFRDSCVVVQLCTALHIPAHHRTRATLCDGRDPGQGGVINSSYIYGACPNGGVGPVRFCIPSRYQFVIIWCCCLLLLALVLFSFSCSPYKKRSLSHYPPTSSHPTSPSLFAGSTGGIHSGDGSGGQRCAADLGRHHISLLLLPSHFYALEHHRVRSPWGCLQRAWGMCPPASSLCACVDSRCTAGAIAYVILYTVYGMPFFFIVVIVYPDLELAIHPHPPPPNVYIMVPVWDRVWDYECHLLLHILYHYISVSNWWPIFAQIPIVSLPPSPNTLWLY